VERVDTLTTEGIGVRVRANGAWGFAATPDVSRQGAQEALGRALALAQALPRTGDAPLAPLDAPACGHWASPWAHDPFAVSLEDKLALLLGAEEALRGDPRITRTEASCLSTRTRTAYASTDGAACTQEVVEFGGGIQAWAMADGDVQVRSYPSAHGGSVAQAGWEHLLSLDLASPTAPRQRASATWSSASRDDRRRSGLPAAACGRVSHHRGDDGLIVLLTGQDLLGVLLAAHGASARAEVPREGDRQVAATSRGRRQLRGHAPASVLDPGPAVPEGRLAALVLVAQAQAHEPAGAARDASLRAQPAVLDAQLPALELGALVGRAQAHLRRAHAVVARVLDRDDARVDVALVGGDAAIGADRAVLDASGEVERLARGSVGDLHASVGAPGDAQQEVEPPAVDASAEDLELGGKA
jgi:hypothetical protein